MFRDLNLELEWLRPKCSADADEIALREVLSETYSKESAYNLIQANPNLQYFSKKKPTQKEQNNEYSARKYVKRPSNNTNKGPRDDWNSRPPSNPERKPYRKQSNRQPTISVQVYTPDEDEKNSNTSKPAGQEVPKKPVDNVKEASKPEPVIPVKEEKPSVEPVQTAPKVTETKPVVEVAPKEQNQTAPKPVQLQAVEQIPKEPIISQPPKTVLHFPSDISQKSPNIQIFGTFAGPLPPTNPLITSPSKELFSQKPTEEKKPKQSENRQPQESVKETVKEVNKTKPQQQQIQQPVQQQVQQPVQQPVQQMPNNQLFFIGTMTPEQYQMWQKQLQQQYPQQNPQSQQQMFIPNGVSQMPMQQSQSQPYPTAFNQGLPFIPFYPNLPQTPSNQ